jgi:hypothetical protein
MARKFIPAEAGVPDWAHVRTYRLYDHAGVAKVIANGADDMGEAEVNGGETSSRIVKVGLGYGYDLDEIQAAAATGIPLDPMRGTAARDATERQIDYLLAQGKVVRADGTLVTVSGVTGLFSITGTTPYTLGTKALGGTTWGTLAAPNATGDEVALDLMGIASNLFEQTQQLWAQFDILLNPVSYDYAAQKRLGSVSDTTALKFAMSNCPYIRSINPWWQVPSGNVFCYANDPIVVAAVVNQEWLALAPQLRGLRYFVPAYGKCGGVISRFPVAISKATGA